jgi:hypothetical protein
MINSTVTVPGRVSSHFPYTSGPISMARLRSFGWTLLQPFFWMMALSVMSPPPASVSFFF